MNAVEEQIRQAARQYLQSGEVSCVIGYERGPSGNARPAFIYQAKDADRLVWGPDCDLNLVTFIHQFKNPPRQGALPPTIAVVVRPCDARAVNLLVQEKQILHEHIRLIHVGEETTAQDTYPDVAEMDNWTPAERLSFWLREFDRCIRCYACRQACPGCYCYECVAEQLDPKWTSIAIGLPEKYFFHVLRAFHLAGRCVDCKACEVVCPMDIPLNLLNRKLAQEVEAMFDYRTGDDPSAAPPLTTFHPDERLL